MATVIRTICDACQARGETSDGRLTRYYDPLTGKPYELDLCDEDALACVEQVQDFVETLAKYGTVAKPKQGQLIETPEGRVPCLKEGCAFTFGTLAGRGQHVTAKHPELADPCEYCDKRSLAMYQHVREHHPDKLIEWREQRAA